MKRKFLLKTVVLFVLAIFSANIHAQEKDENASILERTKELYNKGNYVKAVESINQAIDLKENQKAFPEEVRLMAETSYFEWINSISNNINEGGTAVAREFDRFVLQLKLHPQAASQRIFDKVESVFETEIGSLAAERQKYTDVKNGKWAKINDRIEELEKSQNELFDVIAGRVTIAQIKLALAEIEMAKKDRALKIAVLCVGILLLIVLVILSIFVIKNYQRRKAAQKHFDTSMEVISSMGKDLSENPDLAAAVAEDSKKHLKASADLLGKGDSELQKQIADFFKAAENRKKLADLQNKCFSLGDRIDKYTFRQKTSRKVAELVLKICNEAKFSQDVALVCYCAGMVYDAGFLAVPKNILTAEQLTMTERQKIRNHVHDAADYLNFVPEQIRPIFLQAAEFHHENYDGSGYLAGLSGSKIPFIAGVIHVAESYISMTSKRSYRGIMDSDTAVKELKSKKGVYDPKIIGLLEKVI